MDLSKSLIAQISDALRTPLLGSERIVSRTTKRGTVVTTTKANLPAWFALGGAIVVLFWMGRIAAPSGGPGASSHYQPFPLPGWYDSSGSYLGPVPPLL